MTTERLDGFVQAALAGLLAGLRGPITAEEIIHNARRLALAAMVAVDAHIEMQNAAHSSGDV